MTASDPPPNVFSFRLSNAPVPYEQAIEEMETRVAAIRAGEETELLWFLEHPPLYTAGTSSHAADLIDPDRFPVFKTGRGGQYTYHGPGQRVAYVMRDLRRHRQQDVRCYVQDLQDWLIATLAHFDVTGETREDRVGIWVKRPPGVMGHPPGGEDKIGALGVRIRKWVSFHGVALNIMPDLNHYTGIVPCGVSQHGVTSLSALGKGTDMATVDSILKMEFVKTFGVTLIEEDHRGEE